MSTPTPPLPLPQTLWTLHIPLHLTHASSPSSPPLITSLPRFSYLPLLLPRLSSFFRLPCSSFRHDDASLPLRQQLPLGLLADLYQPHLPWRLVVVSDDADSPTISGEGIVSDAFMNSAKEADFVRNGNARGIMGLSRGMSVGLWEGVKDGNYPAFTKIQNHLLHASPTPLRHVPLRLYVPSAASVTEGGSEPGSFRVVQTLVAPRLADQTPQTLGFALRTVLPTLFPSSRDPVLANVVLHGAPVPFSAPLEELMRDAAYPDGWLCLIVDLL